MTRFEQSKAEKLKRILPLRIFNALGMIAWGEDRYGDAYQKLRMLHPLSWLWLVIMLLLSVVMHGVIEVWGEMKYVWRNDCVWW